MKIDKAKADKFRVDACYSMAELSLLMTDGASRSWYTNRTAPSRNVEVSEADVKKLAKYLKCEPYQIIKDEPVKATTETDPAETGDSDMDKIIRLLVAIYNKL